MIELIGQKFMPKAVNAAVTSVSHAKSLNIFSPRVRDGKATSVTF